MKAKQTVIGEPVRRAGGSPLATRLVENDNPLGKHPWLTLAALAGSLLRFFRFHRPARWTLGGRPGTLGTHASEAARLGRNSEGTPKGSQRGPGEIPKRFHGGRPEMPNPAWSKRCGPPCGTTARRQKGGMSHE
jgi:hypothetical protein